MCSFFDLQIRLLINTAPRSYPVLKIALISNTEQHFAFLIIWENIASMPYYIFKDCEVLNIKITDDFILIPKKFSTER